MDLSNFNALNVPLDTLVTLIFYFVLGMYALFSAILYYHWNTYAADGKVTTVTLITYFACTIPLIIVMAITALIL